MAISTKCPSCKRGLKIKERLAGQSVRCPACEAPFVVPSGLPSTAEVETGLEIAAPAVSRVPMVAAGSSSAADWKPADACIDVPVCPATDDRHFPADVAHAVAQESVAGVGPTTETAPVTLGQLGRFKIKSALGQGGFGTVYRAHDPILDRDVALKVPRAGTKGAERLVLEAKAAARLRHPNIVAVYEAGADGDDLYIATEFVDGQTLAERAQQKPVELATAAEWVKSLAEGLAYAHQEGVVHRDVKPQNVMVGKSDRVQIMDFGLARSDANSDETEPSVLGTPAYMSPEQARGDSDTVGPASDQYSLGSVLYELLTGQRPFSGGPEAIREIAGGAKPRAPRTLRPGIARDLEAVCLKSMASEPQRRYRDCRAMAEDLGRWLNDELVHARRHSPFELLSYWARKRPAFFGWTAAAICLAVLLLGSGVAYAFHILSAPTLAATSDSATTTRLTDVVQQPSGGSTRTITTTRLTVAEELEAETLRYGRLLDRTRLDYLRQNVVLADQWLEQSRWDFRDWEYDYLRRIVTGGWKTIRENGSSGSVVAIGIHPDGRRFASASSSGLVRIWDIATGKPIHTVHGSLPVTTLAYNPNGKFLAVATGVNHGNESAMMGPTSAVPAMPAPVASPASEPKPKPVPQAMPRTPAPPAAPAPSPAPGQVPMGPESTAVSPYGVTLLDSETMQVLGVYREHNGPVSSIAFSFDGQWIVSGSGATPTMAASGDFRAAPPQPTPQPKPTPQPTTKPAPAAPVQDVAPEPAGVPMPTPAVNQREPNPNDAVTASHANTSVRIWNPQTLQTEHELSSDVSSTPGATPMAPAPDMDVVRRLAFDRTGQQVVAAIGSGDSGRVLIWQLPRSDRSPAPPQPTIRPRPKTSPPSCSADSGAEGPASAPIENPVPPNAEPAIAPMDRPNKLLFPVRQLPGAQFALVLESQQDQIFAAPEEQVTTDPYGLKVARNEGGRLLHRWSLRTDAPSKDLFGLPARVLDLAMPRRPNERGRYTLAAAGGDALQDTRPGIVTLYDPVYDFGALVPHLGHTSAVTAAAFRADGKQFVTGDANGVFKVWNAEVHPEVVKLGPDRSATRVAFGSDGRFVAVADRCQSWLGARGPAPLPAPPGVFPAGPQPAGPQPASAGPRLSGVPAGQPTQPVGGVSVYDIRNGKKVLSLTAGPGDVLGLAMDPRMEWVAAGGEDAQIHVWNLTSGQVVFEAPAPGVVRCLAVSRDGKYIAAACGAKTKPLSQPNDSPPPPPAAAMSAPPGDLHYVSLQDRPSAGGNAETVDEPGMLAIWRVADGSPIATWKAHDLDALSVVFSPDGTRLVSSGAERIVRVWNFADQREVGQFEAFDGEIIDLAFRPNGFEVAGVGYDPCRPDQPGAAIVWTVATGARRLKLSNPSGRMYGVVYSPNGKRLVTGGGAWQGSVSRPGEVQVWDAETGIELLPLAGPDGRRKSLVATSYTVCVPYFQTETATTNVQVPFVGPDGKTAYKTEQRSYEVKKPVYHCETKTKNVAASSEDAGTVLGVAFSGDGRCIAAACENGSALVWDAENCLPHDTAHWPDGRLICAAASLDGKYIATAGDSGDRCDSIGLIRIYDALTGRLTREIETSAGTIFGIAFSPDGRRVVSVGGGGEWFPASCAVDVPSPPVPVEILQQFGIKHQNVNVAGRAEVWDVDTGERVLELTGHDRKVACVAVHPLDGRILTGSSDGTVRLWDAANGMELRRWSDLQAVVVVRFAPGGARFALGSADGKVRVGNPDTETGLEVVSNGNVPTEELAFGGSGKQLVFVSQPNQQSAPVEDTPAGSFRRLDPTPPATRLNLWELDPLKKLKLQAIPVWASGIAVGPNSLWYALSGSASDLCLVDPHTGAPILEAIGHHGMARVCMLPDGRVATYSEDRQLKVWKVDAALQRRAECSHCSPLAPDPWVGR